MLESQYLNDKNPKQAKKVEKGSHIFSKILLLMVAIFLALAWYTYNMMNEETEVIKKKYLVERNISNAYPPLTQTMNHQENSSKKDSNETNHTQEGNNTRNIPEGAEYISEEEQLIREEQEANLSAEIYNDNQLIPQDEIGNYQEAVSIPMDSIPVETTMPSLGTPIPKNSEAIKQEHPMLGTPIGNAPMSPF